MSGGPTSSGVRRFASVVIVEGALTHHDRAFTYSVPDGMPVEVGSLVRAPVRGKRTLGVVVDLLDVADVPRPVPLASKVGPGLPPSIVALARWTADRFLSTEGEALAAALPQRVASEERVGSEEREPHAAATAGPALDLDLGGFRNGTALTRSLQLGKLGGFVLRHRPDVSRAGVICSMVAAVTGRGAGALVLLPEVAMRSEVADALASGFGDAVAWLGSDRSARARYRDWLALRGAHKRIAVGGRSAVFAPVPDLGLIIVDDESHPSYKEGRAPRFHARTLAAQRASRDGATTVLVGCPPSAEAMFAVESGAYKLVSLSRPAEREDRPPVMVVDLGKQDDGHRPTSFTITLAARALDAGGRVVILAHRGGDELLSIGDRVSRSLKRAVATLDATSQPGSLRKAVTEAAVIVASPVIAKDVSIVGVGLLAIVDADAALSQPGFRAPEETFATWWRASRWAAGGRIAIETNDPSHPAVRALSRWDPDVLWAEEGARRRELGYPPFASLARIDVPIDRADAVAKQVRAAGLELLGPVERDGSGIVAARAGRRDDLLDRLGPLVRQWRAADEPMRVDVDPWEVLVPRWRS